MVTMVMANTYIVMLPNGFPKAGLAGRRGPGTRRRTGLRRPVHARGGHGQGRSPSTTTLSYVLEELGKLKDLGKKE